jgi:diacylglycerol diphosphate phosphatase/phosphatidate phosphatase
MPFFNKKPQAADADTTTAVGGSNAPASEKKGLFSRRTQTPAEERAAYGNENLNARPRFGQWLKGTIVDIITMVVMGVIGLGVSFARSRSSSVTY